MKAIHMGRGMLRKSREWEGGGGRERLRENTQRERERERERERWGRDGKAAPDLLLRSTWAINLFYNLEVLISGLSPVTTNQIVKIAPWR